MVIHKPITGKGNGLAQSWFTPWGYGVGPIPLKFTGCVCQSSKEEGKKDSGWQPMETATGPVDWAPMPDRQNTVGHFPLVEVNDDLSLPSIIRLSDRETHSNKPKGEKEMYWENTRIYQSLRECRSQGKPETSFSCSTISVSQFSDIWTLRSCIPPTSSLCVSLSFFSLCQLVFSAVVCPHHVIPGFMRPSAHNSNGADCRFLNQCGPPVFTPVPMGWQWMWDHVATQSPCPFSMGHMRTSSEKRLERFSGGVQAGRKWLLEKVWGPFLVNG